MVASNGSSSSNRNNYLAVAREGEKQGSHSPITIRFERKVSLQAISPTRGPSPGGVRLNWEGPEAPLPTSTTTGTTTGTSTTSSSSSDSSASRITCSTTRNISSSATTSY